MDSTPHEYSGALARRTHRWRWPLSADRHDDLMDAASKKDPEHRQQGRLDLIYALLYVAVDAVLGIGSSILIDYRTGLAPSDRVGADGAFEALFFAPSAIDWLDRGASLALEIGALAAALALWRDYGWRVSLPLATAGYVLAQSHFPPYGAIAGLALGIAVWQYLVLKHRVRGQPFLSSPSTT